MARGDIRKIFSDHWEEFLDRYGHRVRPVVIKEVKKTLGCGSFVNAYAEYQCERCGEKKKVGFRCRSRFCGSCGKVYIDDRAENMAAKLIREKHRHMVFTIAEELREYFKKNGKLLELLPRVAAEVIKSWWYEQSKKENYTPGIVAVIHTFGWDLKWNPHVHVLVTEGAAGEKTVWKTVRYVPYKMLRKRWQKLILDGMEKAVGKRELQKLKNKLFQYQNYCSMFINNATKQAQYNDISNVTLAIIYLSIKMERRIMNIIQKHDEEEVFNVGPSRIIVAFQCFGDPTLPPVFLIMGGGAQMINWPEGFCIEVASRGLHPIRFDNRDTGLSTHLSDAPAPDFLTVQSGDFSIVTYTLSDMAADTVGLIDALGFDSVHLVGASMGGMIAQTVAIEYPERVRSLTSMMSTTGDHSVGQPDYAVLANLGAPPSDDRQGFIDWQVRSLKAIGSPKYPLDENAAAENAGRAWDRDHDPLGMLRQCVGVIKSGDRTELLRSLRIPTLVIHGENDKMVDISGGRATAAAIQDAELAIFEGMGHGLPKPLWSEFANRIADLIHRVESSR